MKLRYAATTVVTVTVLAVLLLISSTDLILREKETVIHSVSVIVPDETDELWSNFRKGMEQAAGEWNVDLSFVTLYTRGLVSQQQSLVERELENGAQAIILSAADGSMMSEYLSESSISTPVVTVGSEVSAPLVRAQIGADWYGMGAALAQAIAEERPSYIPLTASQAQVLAICYPGERSHITETWEGLSETLQQAGFSVSRKTVQSEEDVALLLGDAMSQAAPPVIVALESGAMQLLAEGVKRLDGRKPGLYGVCGPQQTVLALEEGVISAGAFYSEYAAGYLSVETAARLLSKEGGETRYCLDYTLLRPDQVFDKEYQMLLFPIS